MRISILLAVLCQVAIASAAENWKDGCPPYFAPESASRLPPVRADNEVPLRGSKSSFGVGPEADTSLGPSRLSTSTIFRRFPDLEWFSTNRLMMHLNSPSGPTFSASYAFAATLEDNELGQQGNLQAYVGLRRGGYLLGDAVRTGVSVRIGGGSSVTAKTEGLNAQRKIDALNNLANLAPFETQAFGFDRPLTLSVEGRVEMIGCHAPFAHVRIDATAWRAPIEMDESKRFDLVYAVPISLAFGGFLLPRLGMSINVGMELRGPKAVLDIERVTRIGLLLDFKVHKNFRLAGRFDALTGDTTAWDVGLGIAVPFGIDGALE